MFRRLRRTVHSDGRTSLDDLCDRIFHRSTPEQQSEFLFAIGKLDDSEDKNSDERRREFVEAAAKFLTPEELADLNVSSVRADTACKECGSTRFASDKGATICESCGSTQQVVSHNAKDLSYKDSVPMIHTYPYRRSNHFQEWLTQFQGRESTIIPTEIFDAIAGELRKRRLPKENLTEAGLKSVLKALRLNKYYEHIPYLLHAITGKKPITLSNDVEEQLKQMFQSIQVPFALAVKRVAPQRRNFLSYSYVLRKFSELLELDDIATKFPLLKSREKLHVQDVIWKDICKQLNWRYIPSM